MIPNKNLFNGAFGKSLFIYGSRCFSTPHSIDVPVQYSINSNLIGEFIASSLDGRLWCLKRSSRYTFFALKWNSDSSQLEFAASIAKSGENFLARGLDWILTDKSFVRVMDDEPFIIAVSLPSLLSVDENNSILDCFTVLPHLGDFQLINNLLIRRDYDGEVFTTITPLEFHQNFSVDAQALINLDVPLSSCSYHVIAHNGTLWGRGQFSFGQVFLLPAVFNLDGSVLSYYLYFQNCSSEFYLSRFSDYNSITPAFFGDNLYGFIYDRHLNLCSVSKDNNIFNLNSTGWEKISEHNGFIFADPFSNRGLFLDSEGITILDEHHSRFDCNTLPQWVAPAGNIDALDDTLVLASDDSSTFVTHFDSAFFREHLKHKILPLSAPNEQGYRFSFGLATSNNRNVLHVNQFQSNSMLLQPVLWDSVYKNPIDIEFVTLLHNVPVYGFVRADKIETEWVSDYSFRNMQSPFFLQSPGHPYAVCSYYSYSNQHILDIYSDEANQLQNQGGYSINIGVNSFITHRDDDIFWFSPINGSIQGPIHISADFPLLWDISSGKNPKPDSKPLEFAHHIVPGFNNNMLGYFFFRNFSDGRQPVLEFIPVSDIPDDLKAWCNPYYMHHLGLRNFYSSDDMRGIEGIIFNGLLANDNLSKIFATFYESSTYTPFALDVSRFFDPLDALSSRNFASISDFSLSSINSEGKFKALHNMHFLAVLTYSDPVFSGGKFDIYIFRSTLHNNFFNFDSELERSYHS